MDPAGVEAVCTLGCGDMRQTLNILQATFMASGAVTPEAAYLCTGNPMPEQVGHITTWLLNDEMQEAYDKLTRMQVPYVQLLYISVSVLAEIPLNSRNFGKSLKNNRNIRLFERALRLGNRRI